MQQRPLVVFDFDGTLADTLALSYEVLNELAEHYGFNKVSKEKLAELKEQSASDVLKFLNIPWYQLPFVVRSGKKQIGKRVQELKLFPKIRTMLLELSRHCDIGILSTNSRKNIQTFFHLLALPEPRFISADISMFGKSRRLKRLRRKTGEFIYVGDELRDIEAASKSSVPVAAVIWGFNTHASLEQANPDWLATNVDELHEVILHFIRQDG